jgi:hypothetical protein
VTIELQFMRKDRNSVERAFSFLFDYGPNGNATWFVVGNGLVMTAYHVVSGDLNDSKKAILGFKPDDQLEVKAFVNNCRATVIKVDKDADLALLQVCGSSKDARRSAFETAPSKDEKLLLIARPNGDEQVRRGVLYGAYKFHGLEYWSMKTDSRDAFPGARFTTRRQRWWDYLAAMTGPKSWQ